MGNRGNELLSAVQNQQLRDRCGDMGDETVYAAVSGFPKQKLLPFREGHRYFRRFQQQREMGFLLLGGSLRDICIGLK